MPRYIISPFMLCLLLVSAVCAQDAGGKQAVNDDQEAQKRKLLETRAYSLIDGLVGALQSLRLPENRIRAEVNLSVILWNKDPDRARNLFRQATDDLVSLISSASVNDSQPSEVIQSIYGLRQEVLQSSLGLDPKMALEFFQSTRLPPSLMTSWARNNEQEMQLQIARQLASKDPTAALAAAEEALANGLSWNLVSTVAQLSQKD